RSAVVPDHYRNTTWLQHVVDVFQKGVRGFFTTEVVLVVQVQRSNGSVSGAIRNGAHCVKHRLDVTNLRRNSTHCLTIVVLQRTFSHLHQYLAVWTNRCGDHTGEPAATGRDVHDGPAFLHTQQLHHLVWATRTIAGFICFRAGLSVELV